MRYRAWFVAKLAAAGVLFLALLRWIESFWPRHEDPAIAMLREGASFLLYYVVLMVWFLLAAAALALIVYDQRRRCRTCLRRLRMPVATGSWSSMLVAGRPRTEYICLYGHGTLKEEELQISGLEAPRWTPHSNDFWEELCASSKESGKPS